MPIEPREIKKAVREADSVYFSQLGERSGKRKITEGTANHRRVCLKRFRYGTQYQGEPV
jgi:hypothetical protein